MALGYRLTIVDSKGNEIFLSSMKADLEESSRRPDISSAKYVSNTLKDDVLSRSKDFRAEIKVKGIITEENKTETCKVTCWSKETDSELEYRKVKLVVYTAEDSNAKILRSYEIESMFVLDYSESFHEQDDSVGTFELYLVQKSGTFKQYIETN